MAFAAALIAVSTLLSRILGYARDAVIAARLGATGETDAYYAAFGLPDLLLYFLAGGALSLAFLPLFQRVLAADGADAAWRLFSNIATTGGLVLAAALAVAWWQAPALVSLLVPDFDATQHELTVRLTRLMLPTPLFFFWGGLLSATQMAQGRFRSTALAPLVYNACIIAGGLLLEPRLGVAGFTWGVVAGAALGPLATNLVYSLGAMRLRPVVAPLDPLLRRYVWLALPLMLGVSLTTVDEWIGRWFASGMDAGSITWLNNARRLMLVPVAFVGQAVGVAALPFLSRLAQAGDPGGLQRHLDRALRATATLSVVAAAGLAVIAPWAVGLVYGHGAYTAPDVARTAALLQVLCLAAPLWCVHTVAVRAFYAREDTWRPMLTSSAAVLLALPAYVLLSARIGVHGLAAATAIGMLLQVLLNAAAYRLVHGGDVLTGPLRGLAGGALLCLPGAGAALLLAHRLLPELMAGAATQPTLTARLVMTLLTGATFAVPTLLLLLRYGGDAADPIRRRLPTPLRRLLTPP